MSVTRTHDMDLVRSILAHPAILPRIGEDGVLCDPVDHEALHWMLVDDGAPAGVFLVHAVNAACFQMHTALLPRIWGKPAAHAAQLLLRWAFLDTGCRKMITAVPEFNRAALRFAKAGGMTVEGVNRASYLHKEVMVDQVMLGITDKEWATCQY